MSDGAYSVHLRLRTELENYIKSQYFGKSPVLLNAIGPMLDNEGVLYRKPYIESSPAYKIAPKGVNEADIPQWLRVFFISLADANLGVYKTPYLHQTEALSAAFRGDDLFVSTGTGSGKTECFMWPLLAKIANEARNSKDTWNMRGVRAIILYPMNALVSDQISRLRKLIGGNDNKFVDIFKYFCGEISRRPQFGMYTSRTPYPGQEPSSNNDKDLVKTLSRMFFSKYEKDKKYLEQLMKKGKTPVKANMEEFLSGLNNSKHIPDPEDAELITRFEMQQFCPDILITNYSMLEYMLLRPIEQKIWSDTKAWLNSNSKNRLLFIIDEAHMYKGSSGGEVALLIRRVFNKLGIERDKVQFILTTASMPNNSDEDKRSVKEFAFQLTSANEKSTFSFITGTRENIENNKYFIPSDRFLNSSVESLETEETRLDALNAFWNGIELSPAPFKELSEAYYWMYDNIINYNPFNELIKQCRGTAVSLDELAFSCFPELGNEDSFKAISVILAIAPLARNSKNAVLFPARMHMLFRGLKGVYACTNPNCPNSHSDKRISIGEVFLNDGNLACPKCGSVVYELYNDRRCGALFFKGYVNRKELDSNGSTYLWRHSGQLLDAESIFEIHLYIPEEDYIPLNGRGANKVLPCYLDLKSGFISNRDDSKANDPRYRKLFYCEYIDKGRPNVLTFYKCPHCNHALSSTQLTSFSTRGNQSFFNLIKTQFQIQPAVAGKDKHRMPNEGRKVLLFSDSRQRAAKLARDMSDISEIEAARQQFAEAVDCMEQFGGNYSIDQLYSFFCISAQQNNVKIFHDKDKTDFIKHCKEAYGSYELPDSANLNPSSTVQNSVNMV